MNLIIIILYSASLYNVKLNLQTKLTKKTYSQIRKYQIQDQIQTDYQLSKLSWSKNAINQHLYFMLKSYRDQSRQLTNSSILCSITNPSI